MQNRYKYNHKKNMMAISSLILVSALTACGGGSATSETTSPLPDIKVPDPKIIAISSSTADVNLPKEFIVSGVNIPNTVIVDAPNAVCTKPKDLAATEFKVTCTFDSVDEQTLQVHAANNQALLKEFKINVLITKYQTLNDTGISSGKCHAVDSILFVTCGSNALSNLQDGDVGRDVTNNDATDGELGFAFSYTADSPDKCVFDKTTGLTWEAKSSANYLTGYTNLGNGAATDASGYITKVNTAKLCGYSDWRLPSASELQGLINYGSGNSSEKPAIDNTWFPYIGWRGLSDLDYWTSTADNLSPTTYSRQVSFDYGEVRGQPNIDNNLVMLVRGYTQNVKNRFVYNTLGDEVIDRQTGLTWKRCSEGTLWKNGQCQGSPTLVSEQGGLILAQKVATETKQAWRVPNIKELHSLVDYSQVNAVDAVAFPAVPAETEYLSSTALWADSYLSENIFSLRFSNYVLVSGMSRDIDVYALRLVKSTK